MVNSFKISIFAITIENTIHGVYLSYKSICFVRWPGVATCLFLSELSKREKNTS